MLPVLTLNLTVIIYFLSDITVEFLDIHIGPSEYRQHSNLRAFLKFSNSHKIQIKQMAVYKGNEEWNHSNTTHSLMKSFMQ